MSRINLIALAVFAGALVWVLSFDTATTRQIQGAVLSVFSPFQKTGAAVRESVEETLEPKPTSAELAAQNAELLQEVHLLRIEARELDELRDENNRLRQLLGYEENSPLRLIPAKVIVRETSTWWRTVVINRGYRQRVSLDSPVVTDQGLVGKTAHVAPDESTVILLTDEKCQLAARVAGTLERGIIMGARGATQSRPDLRLKFLSKEASPQPGAKVYSTNDGGLFPANLLVGEVKSFHVRDIYGEAVIEPAVNFSDLKYVFVIEREEPPEVPAATDPGASADEPAAAMLDLTGTGAAVETAAAPQ